MEIRNLRQVSSFPSQWFFETDGGRVCYVRYRSGWLTADLGAAGARFEPAFRCGVRVLTKCDDGAVVTKEWTEIEPLLCELDITEALGAFNAIMRTGDTTTIKGKVA